MDLFYLSTTVATNAPLAAAQTHGFVPYNYSVLLSCCCFFKVAFTIMISVILFFNNVRVT